MVELVHAKTPREHEPARTFEVDLLPPELGFRRAKAAAVRAFERSFIELVMQETNGNVSAAARLSGKERRAFGKLMKKHGFTKHQFLDQR